MLEFNKIYNMDCLEGLKLLDDECIDLTLTSPPYDDLRTYNGYSFDFENIAKELFRVTKRGGVLVWVVGDKVINKSKTCTSFKQVLKFKEIGFNVYDVMIYQKTSPSAPHKGRYFNAFEYMFVLSKEKPKTINLLCDRINKSNGRIVKGLSKREKDGSLTKKEKVQILDSGIRTNIWTYDTGNNKSTKDKIAFKHPAIFPEQLANDHIISWSNKGDIVLDPFIGSGTVAKMALMNGRKYIGFEISDEYCEISNKRINAEMKQINLFNFE